MAHDGEAVRVIVTTLRVEERGPDEDQPSAEELAAAILFALDAEGFDILRRQSHA